MKSSRIRFVRRSIVFSLLILLVLAGYIFVYCPIFAPRDRVTAVVKNLPRDTTFFCIVYEEDGRLRPIDWSHEKVFASSMHPGNDITSYPWPGYNFDKKELRVIWHGAKRYGLVTFDKQRNWSIWFSNDPVELQNRSWLAGGGEVEFDFKRCVAAPLAGDQVSELRLQGVPQLVKDSQ